MKKFLLIICIFSCAYSVFSQTQDETETFNVYKSILKNDYNLAIRKFTSSSDIDFIIKNHKQELSVIESKTRKDFKTKNQNSIELRNNFGIKSDVYLLSLEELHSFFEKAKYDDISAENDFFKKYGTRTIITLSRVGFNEDKTQAITEISYNTGLCGTCSSAYLYVLSKKSGKWEIIKKVISWIS